MVEVKVTLVPEQIVPDGLAEIETVGETIGKTTMVILFEVAVVGNAHEALEVIITVTTAPFVKELVL